jgi:hypothetical protein
MRLIATLLLTTCALGCGRPAPLPHSQGSPEELARAVLVAIERRDVEALSNLALNEDEFREHVWPELPASRPERNLPLSYVWGDLRQKTNAALGQTLARHGGRKYELRAVRFTGEATEYSSYRVMRKSEVTVREPQGGEQTLRVFGSVIEKGGRFKVFSYVTED